jgi:hypothetical protein
MPCGIFTASASLNSCPQSPSQSIYSKKQKPVPNQYVIQFIESVSPYDISDLADQLMLGQEGREG